MLSLIRSTAAAALAALTLAGAAPAAIVNYDFTATIVDPASGPYSGLTGAGTFTYDDSAIPTSGSSAGNINLFANFFGFPQFDFTLTILGQTFTDVDDSRSRISISATPSRSPSPSTWARASSTTRSSGAFGRFRWIPTAST